MTGKWTEAHRKALAALVARYGRRAVVEAAGTLRPTRRPGRRRDDERRGELWDHVEWIEERVDDLRSDGRSYGALKKATTERFLMVTPRAKQSDETLRKFEKWIKNL